MAGATIGALCYPGSGGTDDHEVWVPLGAVLFGAPAAAFGGVADSKRESFVATERI